MEMAGKAQSALELKRVRKDGSILDVHLWTASLLDANGKIIGNMGILADITARKRAEEKLRRQAELLDLAHDAIIVRDLDNRIVFWNSGAEETYGWGKAEVQGQETHKLLPRSFPNRERNWKPSFSARGNGRVNCRIPGGMAGASSWPAAGLCSGTRRASPPPFWKSTAILPAQKQAEAGRARLAAILEATSDLVGTADHEGQGALSQPGRPENVGHRGG